MKRVLLALVIGGVALLGAYIRLAPSDPDRWHVAPVGDTSRDMPDGVVRVVEIGPNGLAKLDAIVQTAPRTTVLAGSVEDGMITYVTRSKVIGFPDYTTAQQGGDTLRVHGRLRFGRKDFGVNAARVDGWLENLQ